jgi:hypothetical protein
MTLINARTAFVAACALITTGASAQETIRVTVNGDPVNFQTTNPRYIDGRVLVPLRGVFEQLGAFVEWHPETRTVTATKTDTDLRLRIGDRTAWVNGEGQTLDVPATLIAGRTMVPLRFLSEALGAQVQWVDNERLVMITTTDVAARNPNRIQTRNQMRRFALLTTGTVIPVELDTTLSSNNSHRGDMFTATIRDENRAEYADLPAGTKIEGRVVTARPQKGSDPGLLELEFTRIRVPNGGNYAINGSLISLASDSVTRNSEGVLVARQDKKDDRLVYAGVGAGAGLIIGVLTKKPLEGTLLGGLLGYLYGENKRKNETPNDVVLKPGTEFGVRLDQDVRVRQ